MTSVRENEEDWFVLQSASPICCQIPSPPFLTPSALPCTVITKLASPLLKRPPGRASSKSGPAGSSPTILAILPVVCCNRLPANPETCAPRENPTSWNDCGVAPLIRLSRITTNDYSNSNTAGRVETILLAIVTQSAEPVVLPPAACWLQQSNIPALGRLSTSQSRCSFRLLAVNKKNRRIHSKSFLNQHLVRLQKNRNSIYSSKERINVQHNPLQRSCACWRLESMRNDHRRQARLEIGQLDTADIFVI